MHTYLLDTCIWSYWFYAERYPAQHANIEKHLTKMASDSILGISIISWGEAAQGQNVTGPDLLGSDYLRFIQDRGPMTFNIDMHTALKYGELRAMLFEKYAPIKRRKKNLRVEQLVDPITGLELGIQENDLWIAAQAVVRRLILVSSEKLNHIREVSGDELRVENWAM